MERSIQDVARLAGTTSRTLRHYGQLGLLPPSRVGANGYRYYDDGALVRLQRILLLRGLGLALPAIKEILDGGEHPAAALRTHLGQLRREQQRIGQQIESVLGTVRSLERGEPLMAENMFDGFDHTQFKEEVEQRWGADAYASADAWWRAKSEGERRDYSAAAKELAEDWAAAASGSERPGGSRAQELAARHVAWLSDAPGIPREDGRPAKGYILGLGEMYVADPRFSAVYGGPEKAGFVRDALKAYAEANL
ncbi:MerR family transcriptional regulator [Arthrobacter sp. TMN-37]